LFTEGSCGIKIFLIKICLEKVGETAKELDMEVFVMNNVLLLRSDTKRLWMMKMEANTVEDNNGRCKKFELLNIYAVLSAVKLNQIESQEFSRNLIMNFSKG
jgi:hypothetical protein